MEKRSVDFADSIESAITRFSKDKENTDFSQNELRLLNELKKSSAPDRLLPQLFSNTPIASNKIVEYLREAKLRINIAGSQTTMLTQEVNTAASDFWSTLDDVQAELKNLDSDIQEEEIKAEDKFQVVHFNAFNRPIDLGGHQTEQDPKTGLPFLKDQHLEVVPGAGLTLPLVQREGIFIKEIALIDEESDVGDTALPIIKTDPNNLTDPNLAFRYVIARKAFDETGRLYNHTDSTCKLQIEFGHVQMINHISLRPASHSPLFVKQVQYLNESGELVDLEVEVLALDASLDIMLQPIRTSNLFITLIQYSPVEITEIFTGDIRKEAINSFLAGANWSVQLDSKGETLKARIYDFSLESLSVELFTYRQSGFFMSQDINVQKPLSFSLALDTESIQITNTQLSYGTNYFLPEGTVLYESYAKIALKDGAGKHQVRMTVPVPTLKKTQTELLPLIGGECDACFVPNLLYTSLYRRVKSVIYLADYVFIDLEVVHGIAEGIIYTDPLEIFAGIEDPNRNTISVYWSATSPTGLVLKRNDSVSMLASITENTTPKAWVLRHSLAEPFAVYKEETKLTLGTDYEYSLDSGVTWNSDLPTLIALSEIPEVGIAGSFRIKVLNPDYDHYYWCTYRRAKVQFLHQNKLCLLRKNSVVFNKRLQSLSGSIKTMIVLRSDSRIPYLSSVIRNYKLKVREL